ncbi:serine/threonine-protein kinase [Streptomyces sp. NPDC046197]|uniref:serine/threonine-protein kinase n=1 Tax=Streptomyces sp. NPDC046197 TaxID=3154337 RepID=UPI0033D669ED
MHDGESDERRLSAVEESSGDRSGAHSLAGFDTLGDYVLCELLGEGGMGQVYRAYDLSQDREVALKILSPQLRLDKKFHQRFQRESRIVARLNEPHIIPIHRYGEIEGRLYLDMRLVEGEDLRSRLRDRGPLTPGEATDVLAQVADALDAAHEANVMHRDVKPSNILLSQAHSGAPFVYLADFGIARSGGGTTLTAPTQAVGTAEYMAPERFLGAGTDTRIDVYSLACVLYECLTGRTPFPGHEFAAQCHAHIELPPPRVTEAVPGLPAELDDIIAKGMAKQPEERYPTAGELIRHLRRVTEATTTARGHGTGVGIDSGPGAPAGERASPPQDTPPAAHTPPPRTTGATQFAPDQAHRRSTVPDRDTGSQCGTGAQNGTDRERPDDGEPPARRLLKVLRRFLTPLLSRKALLIIAIGVVVLGAGLAAFGLRSSHAPAAPPTAPRTPSANPTPGTGTLSALFTTALPTADDTDETLNPAEQQLVRSSHFVGDCHPMQSVENGAVRAAVHCSVRNSGSSGGPTVVNLYKFDSSDTLDQVIGARTARVAKGSCTSARPVAQNWPTGSAAASGTLYCFTDRGAPAVAWSDDRQGKVTLGVVSGSRMQALYQWWSGNR